MGYDFFVEPTTPIPTDDYFFKGQPQDQATKGTPNADGHVRPDRARPARRRSSRRTTAVANESFVNNQLAASWTGPYPPGRVNGPMTINLYASGVAGAVSGVPLSVTVFADPDLSADGRPGAAGPDRRRRDDHAAPPGRQGRRRSSPGQIPVVDGAPAVSSRLHVQVASGDITEPVTLQIAYGSASASSGLRGAGGPRRRTRAAPRPAPDPASRRRRPAPAA